MTSPAITFDRLAYIDRLKEAGVDDKQARAQADALDAALRDTVATRADLRELEIKLDKLELRLDAKIETSARDLKIWFGSVMVVAVGVILAAIRYLPAGH